MNYKKKLKNVSRPDWTANNFRDPKRLWLDKNENADEVLAKQTKKLLSKINKNIIFSYPNLGPLYKKLAQNLKIKPKNILLTAGSDAAIKTVFETFVDDGDIILRPNPTFAMYGVYSKVFNTKEIVIEYKKSNDGPKLDLKKIINFINKYKPKLVCLPNSDSPTGQFFDPPDLKKIIQVAKRKKSFVLVDEAYFPFYSKTALRLIERYDNLIITRTTAKAWGLAGLRVGYVLSSTENINEMQKVRPMYEINNVGAEIVNLYLSHKKLLNQSVKRLLEGKKYFKKELTKMGFTFFKKEEGNFIHVNFQIHRNKIINELSKNVYFRHNENHNSMKGFSRFSITSKKNFLKIIKIIKKTIKYND